MAWYERRYPYRRGRGWKIEYPQKGDKNWRWNERYALWTFSSVTRRWMFEGLLTKEQADAYGKRYIRSEVTE